MKLTGKAKERFEKWYSENYYKGSITVHGSKSELMNNFISSPISMQWGVYLDFFDSEGIYLVIEPYDQSNMIEQIDKYLYEYSIYQINMTGIGYEAFNTRKEAQTKAIEQANEILNGRL